MFLVGQRVWHRGGKRGGTVVECDGDRVFLVQDNGAELDYRASDLTATAPEALKAPMARVELAAPRRTLTARDITPEHARVLTAVPARTIQAVARVFERRPGVGRFSSLDVAGKLNAITEITAVPYRTMREYSDRPGELGLLMGQGLADSGKGG